MSDKKSKRTKKIKPIPVVINAARRGQSIVHYCSTIFGGKTFVASSKVINPVYSYSAIHEIAKQLAVFINKTAFDSSEKNHLSKKIGKNIRSFIDWSSTADSVEILEIKFRCTLKLIYKYSANILFIKFARTKRINLGYLDVTAMLQSGVVTEATEHMTKKGRNYFMHYGHGKI